MDHLNIAIIGAGTWGTAHANIYNEYERVTLTAVCDQNIEKAREMGRKFGVSEDRIFSSHKEMLAAGGFDAVAIVTPDFAHRDAAVDCALAGKHILIEKPLATTERDARDIMEAVEESGVRAMVDFHNRWNPPFALAKKEIEDGEIGEVYSAYCRLNDTQWVATTLLPWAAKSSILWFLGSHSVDTLRWFFNDEVKRVYSVKREGLLQGKGVDTVDIYQTILEFRNGGIATMENGWIVPDSHPNVNDFKFTVTGTKGAYHLDLSNHNLIQKFTDSVKVPDILVNNFVRERAMGFAYQSIRHFVDCLFSGREFDVSMTDALNVTLTVLKIFESAELGKPVDVIL